MAYSPFTALPQLYASSVGNSPVLTGSTLGTKAKAPVATKPTNTLPSNQTKTTTPTPTTSINGGTNTDTSGSPNTKPYQLPQAPTFYGGTQPQTPAAPAYTPNEGLYGQIVTGLANKANTPSQQYTDLTTSAQNAYEQAANFGQAVGQKESDVQHNPNYSIDTGIGLAGQIAQNQGLKMKALTDTAAGLGSLANTANTQQGLQQSGLQQAASAAAPQSYAPTNIPFNPVTSSYGQLAGNSVAGGLAGVGALQQQQQQGADTQTMIGAYNQATPLIQSAKQQIASSGFNPSPLALANAMQQWINTGAAPTAQYANIFNTLSEIATTISPVLGAQGAQTDLKTMIAQEFIPKLLQGSDIGSVLDNIETNALSKINASKSTAQGAPLTSPAPSSSATFGGAAWN